MAMGMHSMGMASMCHMDCGPKMSNLSMHGHLQSQMYSQAAYDRTSGHPVFSLPPILELRKEKSRDAARSRRGKENYEFYELAKMLPLPGAITSQLDKASIIRLTISYLKLKDFSGHGDPPWNRDGPSYNKSSMKGGSRRRPGVMEVYDSHQGTHILQSLDGFAFALSNDGRFLYISETVSIYLGLSQVEMTGSSVFEYVHDDDRSDLAEQLGLVWPPRHDTGMGSPASHSDEGSNTSQNNGRTTTPPLERALMNQNFSKGYERAFCVRMKSTLTKRGVHVKCSGYRVVQLLTRIRPQFSFSLTRKHPPNLLGTVGVAIALPPPTISELFIDNDMFVTRMSPDFKTIYCEPRISDLMDLSAEDLTSQSLYNYCHPADLKMLRYCHRAVLDKGQVLTDYYRLMNKHGGYVWIQTCATIICSAKNVDDQNIISINYVLSGIEYGGCVLNLNQMKQMSPHDLEHINQSIPEIPRQKEEPSFSAERPLSHPSAHQRGTLITQTHVIATQGEKRKHGMMCAADDVPPMLGPHDHVTPVDDQIEQQASPCGSSGSVPYRDDDDAPMNESCHSKNSRRKNDRPRKRRRESECDGTTSGGDSGSVHDDSADDMMDAEHSKPAVDPALASSANTAGSSSSDSSKPTRQTPSPHDLTVKQSGDDLGALRNTPTTCSTEPTHCTDTTDGKTACENGNKWISQPQCTSANQAFNNSNTSSGPTSSVRDLEEVMNKHLPLQSEAEQIRSGYESGGSSTDYNYNKHKSAIQWIGSQHSSGTGSASGGSASGDTLPATNLLRSLYANRESVIRSNVYNPRPQYSYNEVQASLLTPPGASSDAYKDAVSSYSTSPSVQLNGVTSKASHSPYLPYTSGSANSLTVAMSNMPEPYNITPPASVSPQDKYASQYSTDNCTNGETAMYRQYGSSVDGLTLPIKPQAYPLPAHSNGSYERAVSAQYTAGSYYGHSGFYNHPAAPTPAHYHDVAKNGAW